jgi:hypothetical protein
MMRGVAREVLGLFVDDGWFAATILLWLLLAGLLLPRLGLSGAWGCLLLFAGLAALLLASARRRARVGRR